MSILHSPSQFNNYFIFLQISAFFFNKDMPLKSLNYPVISASSLYIYQQKKDGRHSRPNTLTSKFKRPRHLAKVESPRKTIPIMIRIGNTSQARPINAIRITSAQNTIEITTLPTPKAALNMKPMSFRKIKSARIKKRIVNISWT